MRLTFEKEYYSGTISYYLPATASKNIENEGWFNYYYIINIESKLVIKVASHVEEMS